MFLAVPVSWRGAHVDRFLGDSSDISPFERAPTGEKWNTLPPQWPFLGQNNLPPKIWGFTDLSREAAVACSRALALRSAIPIHHRVRGVGLRRIIHYRWFKPWPFHPLVGGHDSPFKRVTFSPSQKGHDRRIARHLDLLMFWCLKKKHSPQIVFFRWWIPWDRIRQKLPFFSKSKPNGRHVFLVGYP